MSLRDPSSGVATCAPSRAECSVDGCPKPVYGRGECYGHYRAQLAAVKVAKCVRCETRLLEPALMCGFCEVESSPERLAVWHAELLAEAA